MGPGEEDNDGQIDPGGECGGMDLGVEPGIGGIMTDKTG